MGNKTTTQMANELLEKLLNENGITDKILSNCAARNISRFRKMMDIFDLKNKEDQRLTLTLFNLLAQNKREDVINYYINTYNIPEDLDYKRRKDIILLLTACQYYKSFYYFAYSICENIKSWLKKHGGQIIILKTIKKERNRICLGDKWKKNVIRAAADSKGFNTFLKMYVDHDGILGTLELEGNHQNDVRLSFTPEVYQEKKPFEIEFNFTTRSDRIPHKLSLLVQKNNDKGGKNYKSDIKGGIDYLGGIEGDYNVELKLHRNNKI